MTLLSPRGGSGSSPRARASAQAKSWPGTTERSGERSGSASAGTGSVYSASLDLARRGAARDDGRARLADRAPLPRHGRERRVGRGDRPDGEERVERRHRAVREVGRRQRLGGDPAGLEQLERDLARRRELDAAADHEHAAGVGERQRERSAIARRARGSASSTSAACRIPSATRAPSPATCAGEQDERGERVRVGLRRRDRPLRPRFERDRRLGCGREVGGGIVRDRDRERAAPPRTHEVLDDVGRAAGLREPDRDRAREVERRVVVDGERDRVAQSPSSAAAARTRRRRTRPRCPRSRDRPCASGAARARARSPRSRRSRRRARAGARAPPAAPRISAGTRAGSAAERHAATRVSPPTITRRISRPSSSTTTSAGRPPRAARRRRAEHARPGRSVAASSARSTGTPISSRLRTASIIVSTLPASTPSLRADDAVADADVHRAEAIVAVALTPAAGDRVGHERDAAGGDLPDEAHDLGVEVDAVDDRPARRRPGRRSAAPTMPGIAVRERTHRVEDVRHRAHAAVERRVRLAGGRVAVPERDRRSRAPSSRSTSSSAPGKLRRQRHRAAPARRRAGARAAPGRGRGARSRGCVPSRCGEMNGPSRWAPRMRGPRRVAPASRASAATSSSSADGDERRQVRR